MLAEVYKAGLMERTLYKHKRHSPVYYFKYGSVDDCIKLYEYLYYSVPESQYLTRKHEIIERFALEKGRSNLTPQQKEVKWRDIKKKFFEKKDEGS